MARTSNTVARAVVAAYGERDGWDADTGTGTGLGRVAMCQSCARTLPLSQLSPVVVAGRQGQLGAAGAVLITCRKCARYYREVGRA